MMTNWTDDRRYEIGNDGPVCMVEVERVKAAIRLIYPDHLTPIGKRMLEQALEQA